MILLFDTDVLIDLLRGKQKTGLQVEKLTDEAETLLCSVITVAEVFAGMKKNEIHVTEALLKDLIKVELTEETARMAANLKRETKSQQLSLDDCFIAASAIKTGAELVTKNGKHYPFKSLKVHLIR